MSPSSSPSHPRIRNFILLGPPGSGKSTQAETLGASFGLKHIDIGAELRAAAEEDSPFGRELNALINERRELAPDAIMQTVFERALGRIPKEAGVLLDGAPRRASQIDEVVRTFQKNGRSIDRVIFISISEETAVSRIARRYLCLRCHQPYILGESLADPAKPCQACGGKIGKRHDDTPEGVHKRYRIFSAETLPVIEYFRKEGLLLEVDGNRTAAGVSRQLQEKLA